MDITGSLFGKTVKYYWINEKNQCPEGARRMIKIRKNVNVAAVPVPICDPCWEGYCTGCEGGNCACQSTHYGPDWDEVRGETGGRH